MKRTLFSIIVIGTIFIVSSCNSTTQKTTQDKNTSTENTPIGLSIGNKAPDLEYSSPTGEKIRLSSLRGKVVLIDFWASWCPPCRMENPNLVATYKNYKDKEFKIGSGFTIYGVSLDKDKNAWVQAIKNDNLTWTHVSDLKYWNSQAAAVYQINSIPSNVLIDGNGIILARNLRGASLSQALENFVE